MKKKKKKKKKEKKKKKDEGKEEECVKFRSSAVRMRPGNKRRVDRKKIERKRKSE